jgi:hypothetical protein
MKDEKIRGNGRHSEFFVNITCLNLISGDAKNKTPTLQQSKPINFEAFTSSGSIRLYTTEKAIMRSTSNI